MDARYFPAADAYVRYLDLPGAGPARVFVHCLGGAAALYVRSALDPALVARRTILIDLLGFGLSDRPSKFGYAPADHAGAVAAVLGRERLRDCEVIGHSLGGHVATALALGHPELVARLVLAEAPLVFGAESASRAIAAQTETAFCAVGYRAFVEELRADADGGDPAAAIFVGAFATADARAIHRSAVGLVRDGPGLRDRFMGLSLPRAYLWGAGTLRDPAQARWLADLAARGVVTAVVPEAGHQMNLDNPAGFAATLAGVSGRGSGPLRSV